MGIIMTEFKDHSPPIDDTDAKIYGLFDWQSLFRNIFHDNNLSIKKTGYLDNQVAYLRGYVLSHISQDLGDLAEAIRESDEKKLRKKTGSMFAWIFALINELNENIETIIDEKYPGICPYCKRRKDCNCAWWVPSQTKKDKKIETTEIKYERNTIPPQLTGWIDIWEIMYGRKYKIAMSKSDIMYKILEEEAEILEELDKAGSKTLDKTKEYYIELKKEIADFFSWFLALLYKMETEKYLDRKDLPLILYDKFKEGCPWCKKVKCICKPCWLNETS